MTDLLAQNDVFLINIALLAMVAIVALGTVLTRNLLASAMLLGVFGLLMATVWTNMFALDVSLTEAAIGAGISTLLILGTLSVTGIEERRSPPGRLPAAIIVAVTGTLLIYGTLDMPHFGDRNAPVQSHLSAQYLSQQVGKASAAASEHPSGNDFGGEVPNAVTAILADYRGYDTLFETTVVFAAGISVLLLLRREKPGGVSR